MSVELITGAAAPLVAADVRGHCSIAEDDSFYDSLLTKYIAAANNMIEEKSGKAFGAQTWKLRLDAFPVMIALPRGPVTGVSWIKYIDANGTEQTLDAAKYITDLVSNPARIVPVPDSDWPETQARINAVTVQFVSGYTVMPDKILQCIRATVAAWFETRDMAALPNGVIEALDLRGAEWGFA